MPFLWVIKHLCQSCTISLRRYLLFDSDVSEMIYVLTIDIFESKNTRRNVLLHINIKTQLYDGINMIWTS